MTSDNKRVSDDEEYQYPDEEYVSEPGGEEEAHAHNPYSHEASQASAPQQEGKLQFIKDFVGRHRRIVIAAGIGVFALITLKIMNHHKNNKVIMKAKPAVVTQPVVQKPVVQQPVTQSVSSPVVTDALSSIKQDSQTNHVAISGLQNQVQALQTQLASANQNQHELNQVILILASQLKNLNQHMSETKAVAQTKPSGPPSPEVVYHIRAIISGRAWIVGSNGLTDSVTVGDPIPDYGLVKAIDADHGVIDTSSGKKIRLGVNDY